MILEYVLDQPSSFCLAITPRSSGIYKIPADRTQIDNHVRRYLDRLETQQNESDLARELYSILLAPVHGLSGKRRLIVVPDGSLNRLPFEPLLDDKGQLVLKSHVVTYAPSSTVLYELRAMAPYHAHEFRFLGMGGIRYSSNMASSAEVSSNTPILVLTNSGTAVFELAAPTLADLPQSGEEVRSAAKAVGMGATLLLGQAATETAFKSEPLEQYSILHFAVHAIADKSFPDRSALVLARDPKSGDDGLLQAREIIRLPLQADLVVLSACDTNVGREQGEEGYATVVRSFLLAGAEAVLANLWLANDNFSAALLKHFYEHLSAGQDSGTALQQAKLELLEEFGRNAVPFYWAGVTVTGDATTPTLKDRTRPDGPAATRGIFMRK
jgi:CHAT domain-containing protein